MCASRNQFLDIVKQEFHLPEINPDACVYSYFEQADCQACVDACPAQAWVLDDDGLGLDTNACDGCGLCVPACPSSALHVHFPWVIRPFCGQIIALFACDKSDIDEPAGLIPCIHTLGLKQLLLLHNSGINHLLMTTAECNTCSLHQATGLYQRVEQLNRLLLERNKPTMKILQRPSRVWKKIFRTDEIITRGTQLSRREFLRGGGQQLRQQLVIMDPLNLPECQAIPLGQLLPDTENTEVHWPWVPRLDENRCNGCDACIRLCPTDALRLSQDEENTPPTYQLYSADCTGCGVCAAVCESEAISIHSWSVSTTPNISLKENHCMACGNPFHLPEKNSRSEETLCRICAKHNHNSNLFQVLA